MSRLPAHRGRIRRPDRLLAGVAILTERVEMNVAMHRLLSLFILLTLLLAACRLGSPTPDLEATVNAQATQIAALASPAAQETTEPATGPQPGGPQDEGLNPFTAGSPELLDCLRQALGEELFNTFADMQIRREPTQEEMNLMGPCMMQNGQEFGSGGGGPGEGGPSGSEPTPAPTPTTAPTLAPEPEVCPSGATNHADLMNFDWQSRPMRSGEAANIVYSPSDPDVLYMGIEVNTHSLYKSTDGGRTWSLLLMDDHAKDVAVHPTNPDVAFVTDSQKVWRTTSGGRRVRPPSRDDSSGAFDRVLENPYPAGPSETSFSAIAVARSNPEVVYTAIKGSTRSGDTPAQLFRSTDGGASFNQVGGKIPMFNVLLVDPEDDRSVLAGSVDGVYISRDGGESFTQLASWSGVVSLDTNDGRLILAGGDQGVLRSEDGGATWAEQSQGLPAKPVLRVRLAPSAPSVAWATTTDGVARSTDGGKTWTDASGSWPGTGLPSRNLQALAVHPEDPDVALVSTQTFTFSVRSPQLSKHGQYYAQGIFRTEDGGQTWSRSDTGIFEFKLEDITAHPARPFEVWAAQQASRGFYRSRDAGQTWSLSPSLLTHYPMRFVFFPDNPNKAASTSSHSSQDFGITLDSGVNWQVASEQTFFDSLERGKPLLDASLVQGGNLHLHGLAIDPENPEIIYVGSNDDPSQINPKPLRGSHIFKSVDGGITWVESDNGYDHEARTSIHEIRVDPRDPRVIYVGTTKHESTDGNGIWRSVDAGTTWARANSGMPNDTNVSVILAHPARPGLLLAGTLEGIYLSTDDSASWQLVNSRVTWDMEYDPAEPDIVYAGTEEGIFLSLDFGETWQDISFNLPAGEITALAVNCNGTVVYAGVAQDWRGDGLFVSIASSIVNVPVDSATGVEYGSSGIEGPSGPSEGGPSAEQLQCMIESLGEEAVMEFGAGGRQPTEEEISKFMHCFSL